jgi:hypothetical protein
VIPRKQLFVTGLQESSSQCRLTTPHKLMTEARSRKQGSRRQAVGGRREPMAEAASFMR